MQLVVDGSKWLPGAAMNCAMQIGSRLFTVYNAGSGYSFDKANTWAVTSRDGNKFRFEVRKGDTNWFDRGSGKERSEIGSQQLVNYGTAMEVKYKFDLASAEKNTANWMVIGQIHQVFPEGEPASPAPFAINLAGERMVANIRYNDASGKIVQLDFPIGGKDIVRGQTYDMDIKAVFDGNGNGRLVISRDGVVYVDYSGPMGYKYGGQVYWKEGIYRFGGKGETQVAEYAGLTITTGDAVQLPPKGAAGHAPAAAPTLDYDHGSVVDGGAKVSFTGHAVAGQTVTLYDEGKAIGTTIADAKGNYALTVEMGEGRHHVVATTTDANGAKSVVSHDVPIEIGNSQDILNRMDVLPSEHGLAAIFLTDGNVFTVASVAQMQALVASGQAALTKIEGGYSFQYWSGVKGYRTITKFDATGKMLEAVTISTNAGGEVTRLTDYHPAGTSPYAKEVFEYSTDSKAMTYRAVDASGKTVVLAFTDESGRMTSKTVFRPDGSSVKDVYSSDGHVTETVTKSNGLTTKTVLPGTVDVSHPSFPTAPSMSLPHDPKFTSGPQPSQPPVSTPTPSPTPPATTDPAPTPNPPATVEPAPTPAPTPVKPTPPTIETAIAQDGATAGSIVLSGHAAAGQTVTLYDGGKAIATVVAGADGDFSAKLSLSGGSHKFQASAAKTGEAASNLSGGLIVEVGKAADILARMKAIAGQAGLSKIILTDSHVLQMASSDQMKALIASSKGALDKIDGGYSFKVVSGPADRKTVTTYDAAGATVEAVTTTTDASGRAVKVVDVHVRDHSPYASEVYQYGYSAAGKGVTYRAYDAAGNQVVMTQTLADGTLTAKSVRDAAGNVTIDKWTAAGRHDYRIVSHPDGSSDSVYNDGPDRNVVVSHADGWSDTKFYNNNVLTTEMIKHAPGDAITLEKWEFQGGQRTYTAYAGKQVVNTQHYNADGVMDRETRVASDGSTIKQTFDAGGRIASEVTSLPSGERISKTFVDGVLTKMSDYHPATGTNAAWTETWDASAVSSGIHLGAKPSGAAAGSSHGANGLGGVGHDVLVGSNAAETLSGGAGNDKLYGNAGNDILIGGAGHDVMTGGAGADRFTLVASGSKVALADLDDILDFNRAEGDRIDLTGLRSQLANGKALHLVSAFGGSAGEMTISGAGSHWTLAADTNGDHHADYSLAITSKNPLAAADLIY